jgi:ubiquitin conjugation factor E4 B
MDRGVIVRHLLSNATDPFTRKPMKLEDVVPNTELKLKIETWLAEKRNSRST